jgi:hypothetical protein
MRSMIKKNVPWVVLGMLVVTAVVAIWAVISDEMGEIQEKILMTTGTLSGGCILILPCLARTERRYGLHAAWTGVVLISGTAVLTVVIVWVEPDSRAMERAMISGWIASAAAFAAFITLLAKLSKRWAWVQAVTVLLIATLAAELIYSVWVQVDWGEEILATNVILMTLGIISAWVLHVVQWLASRRPGPPGPGRVMCPRCGKACDQQPGDMQCGHCSTVFAVKA